MAPRSLNGRRILVVEDDYMIAQQIQLDLEQAGALVLGPVPSVGKALDLLQREGRPDAAVLDVNLGDEKSFAIAQRMEASAIPFLFATGYGSGDIPAEWRHAKVVMKPLRLTAVGEMLEAQQLA